MQLALHPGPASHSSRPFHFSRPASRFLRRSNFRCLGKSFVVSLGRIFGRGRRADLLSSLITNSIRSSGCGAAAAELNFLQFATEGPGGRRESHLVGALSGLQPIQLHHRHRHQHQHQRRFIRSLVNLHLFTVLEEFNTATTIHLWSSLKS